MPTTSVVTDDVIGAPSPTDPSPLTVLSLGDSFSCGEGVGVRLDVRRTWAGVLAEALGARHDVLAVAGATTAQVRSGQLPMAASRPRGWVTLLVGLNDVFRTGFDAERAAVDLDAMVGALVARHHRLVLARLHDPTEILPVPRWIRSALRARVAAINEAVDAAVRPGVVVVDLAAIEGLRARDAWAVDRLHPSVWGHVLIASAAAHALVGAGAATPMTAVPTVAERRSPSKAAECRWVAQHGVPWVARRARMLGTVLATMLTDQRVDSVSAH